MPLLIDPPGDQTPVIRSSPDGKWVVTTPGRLHRPKQTESNVGRCPFCEGHEADTPPENWSDRIHGPANTPGWKVRVVPNLFPILAQEPSQQALSPSATESSANQPCRPNESEWLGIGRHEVIVERPDHADDWSGLDEEHLTSIFTAYRDRLASMEADDQIACAVLFKNGGPMAGASQFHAHAQLIGFPAVPAYLQQTFGRATPVDQVRQHHKELIIHADETLVVYAPPASIFPLEVWISPADPINIFTHARPRHLSATARATARLLSALAKMIDPLAFHFFLHTASPRQSAPAMERWTLKIAPRLESLGGLEWASNVFINPLPPAWAAEQYRQRWHSK